jgi:hypothetical protein
VVEFSLPYQVLLGETWLGMQDGGRELDVGELMCDEVCTNCRKRNELEQKLIGRLSHRIGLAELSIIFRTFIGEHNVAFQCLDNPSRTAHPIQ